MLSRQITWAIAMIEGTREGMRIEPRRPWTRALLAIARAIAWLEELGAADQRCVRCGFYMRPHRDFYGYQCLLCGSRMPVVIWQRYWINLWGLTGGTATANGGRQDACPTDG